MKQAAILELFERGTTSGFSDRALLDRFRSGAGEAADLAFAAIVERHGGMVLRACRASLAEPADADDAFQATFLILARRSGSIRDGESIGAWLHGVALRVAANARALAARRRRHERSAATRADKPAQPDREPDLGPIIHEEVVRLPGRHREAVVLCYFEGLTHDQAADRLGCPVGTVRSRLAGARDRLRTRLTRRGLAPAVVAGLGRSIVDAGPMVVPSQLIRSTTRLVAGVSKAGAIPARVAGLVAITREGMTMTRWISRIIGAGLAAGLVGIGAVSTARQTPAGPVQGATPAPARVDPATTALRPPRPSDPRPTQVGGPKPEASRIEPPPILDAQLAKALRLFRTRLALVRRGAIASDLYNETAGEVELAAARLKALRDELRDDLELQDAAAGVRRAELAGAERLVSHAESDARSIDVKDRETKIVREDRERTVELRRSQLAVKVAELREVEVRIDQIRRKLDGIAPLVGRADAAIREVRSTVDPPGPPPPPAAPGSIKP